MAYAEAYAAAFLNNRAIVKKIWGMEIGRIETGARADLILVDYYPPTPLDRGNLFGHLLFGIANAPVDSLMVNGRYRAAGQAVRHRGRTAHGGKGRRARASLVGEVLRRPMTNTVPGPTYRRDAPSGAAAAVDQARRHSRWTPSTCSTSRGAGRTRASATSSIQRADERRGQISTIPPNGISHRQPFRLPGPTYHEMLHPEILPEPVRRQAAAASANELDPANLFNITWRRPDGAMWCVELPRELTGVEANILVLVGR